jgi:hypothetical protein
MKSWVKCVNNTIIEGPIGSLEKPEGEAYKDYVEYIENINLPPNHGPITLTIELIDGKCVKTVTAEPSYEVQRAAAYPGLGDQLDMLWHAMDTGVLPKVEPFYTDILNIKAQYPKPEQ